MITPSPDPTMGAHVPSDDAVTEFARRHGISEEQARGLLVEHGNADESRLTDAVRNLRHFLRAPS